MTTLREAAQQALEALTYVTRHFTRAPSTLKDSDARAMGHEAIAALRAALAQPEQEKFCDSHCTWLDHHPDCVRAEQPQRTLTDEVIANLWHANGGFHHHFARAIERWLRGHA